MLEIKELLPSTITRLFTVTQGMTRTVMKWHTAGLNYISIQCRENRLHV